MAASKMSAPRMDALGRAVRWAAEDWRVLAEQYAAHDPEQAAKLRERAGQAEAALGIVAARFEAGASVGEPES